MCISFFIAPYTKYHLDEGGFSTLAFIISIPRNPQRERKLLRQFIESLIKQLQQKKGICKIKKQTVGDRCLVCCQFPDHKRKMITSQLGHLLSEYFFRQIKSSWTRKLIHDQYHSPYPEDLHEIEQRVKRMLRVDRQQVLAKKKDLAYSVQRFLEKHNLIAIDGYLRFRTQSYREWFRRYVRRAIDEYVLDQEYQEFIQLLKYFVSMQKSRFIRVHVIHKGCKKFQLLKEDGTPILVNDLDHTFHEMVHQSFSGEDFIVGALLSTAPKQVVLHTKSTEENIILTLLQIFDGRITLCSGCHRCFSH